MRTTFLPFARPDFDDRELREVSESLMSGWLTSGPKVAAFEAEFATAAGVSHAIAVNSCTAALHLALEAIGLGEGDAVLTTPYTFAASAEVIRYFNATPLLIDVEPSTLNINPDLLEESLARAHTTGVCVGDRRFSADQIKAIIPVHVAGQVCDMHRIGELARAHSLKVIEDAAHSLPSADTGARLTSTSHLTCFSFYATKPITTGEGGMICTADDGWADRCRVMRLHGISRAAWARGDAGSSWRYEIIAPGFKYNMTDVAAALGRVQLQKMTMMAERRRVIAERYTSAFDHLDALQSPAPAVGEHSWHLYLLRLHLDRLTIDRDRFINELHARNIGTSVHFIPLHMHGYYRNLYGYHDADFPVACSEFNRVMSLPLFSGMTAADVDDVIEAVRDVAMRFRAH